MFNKIWTWAFRKSAFGKFIDGHKTWVSFLIVVLAFAIDALSLAAGYFPMVPWIVAVQTGLIALQTTITPYLKDLGFAGMVVGIADKAKKDTEKK